MVPDYIQAQDEFDPKNPSWDGVKILSDLWQQLTEEEQQELNDRELGLDDVLFPAYQNLMKPAMKTWEKN